MIVGCLQLALALFLVGVNVPVAKLLAETLPIPVILFLRCILACVVLLPLARLFEADGGRLPRGLAKELAWQAVFGTALYNVALLWGLRLTSALEAGLVLASLPAVVALGAWLVLRERLAAGAWAAVALAALGIAVLNTSGAALDEARAGDVAGNALVFGAVVSETIFMLLTRRVAGRVGNYTAVLWMQVFSVVLLAPFAVPALLAGGAAGATEATGGLLLFHALTSSVLCLVLWYAGVRRAPAFFAGVSAVFLPAGAAATAIVVLGEAVTPAHALGFGLMVLSVVAAAWRGRG